MNTDNTCKYSQVQEPCILREPTNEECHICLEANYEKQKENDPYWTPSQHHLNNIIGTK